MQPAVPPKLAHLKITPIEWPKVPGHIEDALLSVVIAGGKQFGDNQYELSKAIKTNLESMLGGNWIAIICPADQKTYNIHYTPALVPGSNYEALAFTFEYDTRRYLVFKAA